jgi:hypothetical protein
MDETLPTITKTLMYLGEKNLNDRTYLNNENLREKINEYNEKVNRTGVGFGEIGYPEYFDISLSKASHSVKNVRIENAKVFGDVTLLKTKAGDSLQEMLDQVVFRPRASGRANEDGTVHIDKIFAFDAIKKEDDAFKGIISSHEVAASKSLISKR